jgi:CHAT domain-containing protein/Tfp pilus assembly protein PilF
LNRQTCCFPASGHQNLRQSRSPTGSGGGGARGAGGSYAGGLEPEGTRRFGYRLSVRAGLLGRYTGDQMTWQAVQQLSREGRDLYAQGDMREAQSKFEEALRIAQEIGHRRGEGQLLANLGAVCGELGRRQEAVECLERALAILREIGDRRGAGAVLNSLGTVYYTLGRPQEALEHYQQALTIARQAGDRDLGEAALVGLGDVYRKLGQPHEALTNYQHLLNMHRDAGNSRGVGTTLIHSAKLYRDLGQLHEALAAFQQALTIHREVGDCRREAQSLHGLGDVYANLGQTREGLEHYQRALAIRRDVRDLQGEGATCNNMGMLYDHLGRFEDALNAYERALSIARELGDRVNEGATLHCIAHVYLTVGRLQEAVEFYQRSLAIAQEVGDRQGEGRTLASLGGAYYEGMRQPQDALPYFQQALEIQTEMQDDIAASATLCGLGVIFQTLDHPQEALAHYQQALAACREVGNRGAEGAILHNLGMLYKAVGRPQQALACYEEALHVLCDVGSRRGTMKVLHSASQLDYALGRPRQAMERLKRAIEIVEGLRGEIASEELRSCYFATVGDLYADYVALLVDQSQTDLALQQAERGKARVFLELLAEAQAEIRAGVAPELWEEERRLLGELGTVRQRLGKERSRAEAERDSAGVAELEWRARELERAYQANQAEIRRRNPRYAALTHPQVWELSRIQRELLDERTALLEYVLRGEASLLFVVLHDDFAVFVLPPKEEIETKVRELRAALVLPRYPHGHELYRTLVQPAEHLIQGKDLLIVADGALHYLPFALLLTAPPEEGGAVDRPSSVPSRAMRAVAAHAESELLGRLEASLAPLPPFDFIDLPYLVRRHALSYAPSATVAGTLRKESRQRGDEPRRYDGQLAAFADPVTEELGETVAVGEAGAETSMILRAALNHTRGGLERIPLTADEVWALARLFSGTARRQERTEVFRDDQVSLRTGASATKEAVTRLTAGEQNYRFFHIASHGLVDMEKPQFSGLVFTPGERHDPYWQTFEIFNARIASDMAVLSACETGLGPLVRGEGIVGLVRAFMYAGALSVCVSLWKVADESTPLLMEAFYRGVLAGHSKAKALRRAQLCLMEEVQGGKFAHPFFWAPFVLVGERQ